MVAHPVLAYAAVEGSDESGTRFNDVASARSPGLDHPTLEGLVMPCDDGSITKTH